VMGMSCTHIRRKTSCALSVVRITTVIELCGFSVFWFTTLTFCECLMDVSGGNILSKYTFQFIFTTGPPPPEFVEPAQMYEHTDYSHQLVAETLAY
jgi:hypothetical protein